MTNKKLIYDYWHKILKINPERKHKYPDIKEGSLINWSCVRNGRWEIIDFSENKPLETWNFKVKYVGRLPRDLTKKKRIEMLQELLKK